VDSRGRTFLFLEEVPNATDRGHISCREISDGSSVSAPTRIIAQPYHLSYPFVLFDGADFFMLPESSANATVELYRAVNFPYEWRLEQMLQNEVALVETIPPKWARGLLGTHTLNATEHIEVLDGLRMR